MPDPITIGAVAVGAITLSNGADKSSSGDTSDGINPPAVESWRGLVTEMANGIPVEFLLNWIRVESGGNPCSVGIKGKEAGIAQTYHPDDDKYGATFSQLRAACDGDTSKLARPLTDAERRLQVIVLVNYVTAAANTVRAQLLGAGATWVDAGPLSRDFWRMVKLRHALPAIPAYCLKAYRSAVGKPPPDWQTWRRWFESLSASEVVKINSVLQNWSSSEQRARLLNNAEKTSV